jgi:hypothetical protein
VELPANPIRGTRIIWKIPSQSLIRDMLRSPFYAGASVWGRRPVATVLVKGRLEKRQGSMRRAIECRVFLPDHHEAYIDWATYEEKKFLLWCILLVLCWPLALVGGVRLSAGVDPADSVSAGWHCRRWRA